MTKSAVINGIQHRLEHPEDQVRDGTFYWLADILADNGLPSQDSHTGGFDPEYISFMADVAELLERLADAANADCDAEMTFIERQIDVLIAQAKQRWSITDPGARSRY
jgi:hypothetical protein